LAAAFLTDQVAPKDDDDEMNKGSRRRDASPIAVATEGKDGGRLATTPSEIPARLDPA
jgi:hypothetical protein